MTEETLKPGGRSHMQTVPYTEATIDNMKRYVLQTIQDTFSKVTPLVKQIIVENMTKTVTVKTTVTVDGIMRITVTNEEQDSQFRFE